MSFFYLFARVLWFNVQWRCVEKSCETFCNSVSQKEAEPCFILHLRLSKWNVVRNLYHTVSPFRAFMNDCQFSHTHTHSYQMVILILGDDCTFWHFNHFKIHALNYQKIVFRCVSKCVCPSCLPLKLLDGNNGTQSTFDHLWTDWNKLVTGNIGFVILQGFIAES